MWNFFLFSFSSCIRFGRAQVLMTKNLSGSGWFRFKIIRPGLQNTSPNSSLVHSCIYYSSGCIYSSETDLNILNDISFILWSFSKIWYSVLFFTVTLITLKLYSSDISMFSIKQLHQSTWTQFIECVNVLWNLIKK